jgi:hypothetical protein
MHDWVPANEVRQIRWQIFDQGDRWLQPVQAGMLVLDVFQHLLGMHPSIDENGAAIRPIPR